MTVFNDSLVVINMLKLGVETAYGINHLRVQVLYYTGLS